MRGGAATGPEAVWRKALEARGRDWVVAELRRRPGQARDPLLDVVFEEPYPTREYCHQWCAEEENRFHFFSWSIVAAGALLLIMIVCLMHAVSSRTAQETEQARQAAQTAMIAASPAPSRGFTPPTNDIPASGASSAPSTAVSRPSLCDYQSYQSAACPVSK